MVPHRNHLRQPWHLLLRLSRPRVHRLESHQKESGLRWILCGPSGHHPTRPWYQPPSSALVNVVNSPGSRRVSWWNPRRLHHHREASSACLRDDHHGRSVRNQPRRWTKSHRHPSNSRLQSIQTPHLHLHLHPHPSPHPKPIVPPLLMRRPLRRPWTRRYLLMRSNGLASAP